MFLMQVRKLRHHRIIFLLVFIIIMTFCFLLYYNNEIDQVLMKTQRLTEKQIESYAVPVPMDQASALRKEEQFRVVHLDLKGAPPKLSYLRTLLPLVASSGANALLLEYEDMFPYEGSLRNLSAKNAYSMVEIKELLSLAKENHLEVIPLVQTFGHLEFALKLEEFRYLRELDAFPQEVCPSNPASLGLLVYEMISQIMDAHSDTRYLHIGCDEVFHLAACGRCSKRKLDGRVIFTEHVTRVATHVREVYHVTPLVWDDMFRQWSPMDLADSGLGNLVEPVVWVYIADITNLVPHYVWHMYGGLFPNVWVAGAFKGAFGETNVLPDIGRHVNNQLAWVRLMKLKTPAPVANFRGVMLTGWARYDHFAVLCELLPSAVPSLVLSLLVLKHAFEKERKPAATSREDERRLLEDVFQEWGAKLSCPPTVKIKSSKQFSKSPFMWELKECQFPGRDLFGSILNFVLLKGEVDNVKARLTVFKGWLTEYNIKHNFSSPWRVMEGYPVMSESGKAMSKEVEDLKTEFAVVLSKYFDEFTAREWIELKVEPLVEAVKFLETSAKSLMARHVWPRRPLA